MDYSLEIIGILTIGFALASLLGYLLQRIKLPTILGYLIAGYIIGPYFPGFVANKESSEQLAEVGVILMLFGVGLHFRLRDLMSVKKIAIPGAIGQTVIAAIIGTFVVYKLSWSLSTGIIIGLAIGVASTVVLVRVLSDNKLLDSIQGHIAVGWLIVEDILTVIVLVLLPILAKLMVGNEVTSLSILWSVSWVLIKFALLIVIMFTIGQKAVTYILTNVARLRSHELFTLTVLGLIFLIATGSAYIFGTSIAIGAFIAGMIVGQTDVKHQASANALPLKDMFAVLFFLSIGMLFNPRVIIDHFALFISILGIILIIKPLTAFLIVLFLKFPINVAITVAIALAQIGEFSFILAEQATRLRLLQTGGYDIVVACAMISIALNPLIFRLVPWIDKKTSKWNLLNVLKLKSDQEPFAKIAHLFESRIISSPNVIIVGFGVVGQKVFQTLEKLNISTTIIEQNIDAIPAIKDKNRQVIYGDATHPSILESTRVSKATLLVITTPEIETTLAIIKSASHLNPRLHILARVMRVSDTGILEEMKVDYVCAEEETGNAFSDTVQQLLEEYPYTKSSKKFHI